MFYVVSENQIVGNFIREQNLAKSYGYHYKLRPLIG